MNLLMVLGVVERLLRLVQKRCLEMLRSTFTQKDERYPELIGKVILPLVNKKKFQSLRMRYVDMEFGTGVVKITPAHDPNMALR